MVMEAQGCEQLAQGCYVVELEQEADRKRSVNNLIPNQELNLQPLGCKSDILSLCHRNFCIVYIK